MEDFDAFFDPSNNCLSTPSADLNNGTKSIDSTDHDEFFSEYDISKPEWELIEDDGNAEDEQSVMDANLAHNHGYQFRSYDLRPGARHDGKAVWITWLDTDESGNYDPTRPETERRTGRSRKRSSSRHSRPQSNSTRRMPIDQEDEVIEIEPRAAELSRLAARQQGVSITVTLDLTTPALQRVAANIPDHWPGENYNILSDEHYKYLADQINSRADSWRPYNLRRRVSLPCEDDDHEGLVFPAGRIPDPLGHEVDLRNHPAARGCAACRTFREDCTLMNDEFTWPCYTCAMDGIDCELLTIPSRKARCEYCSKKRLSCSYVIGASDPFLPCTICASIGIQCVAGPERASIRERIRYGKDYTKVPQQVLDDRKFVTCTECRQKRTTCSLRSKVDMPPCVLCQQEGIECTFERLKPQKSITTQVKTATIAPKIPTNSPDNTIVISTALNHPIHFLHEDQSACTWCTRAIGVCGRGVCEVTVIPSADGLYYTEVSGGQNSDGKNCEYMCETCTMERVRVFTCEEHELRPLDKTQTANMDYETMFHRIINGTPLPSDRWCALCPAPALFECCTTQNTDMWGKELDPRSKDAEGCGLILCEECAVRFGELGNLEEVMDAIPVSPDVWPVGARADIDFLRRGGLLEMNFMGLLGIGVDEMEVDGGAA